MWSYLDREDITCVVEDVDGGGIAEGYHVTIYIKLISLLLFIRADDAFESFELVGSAIRDDGEEKGLLVNAHVCFQF